MRNLLRALFPGVVLAFAGLCFFFSPYGQRIEENLGLALLFTIRGPRLPPDNVIIINLDRVSSQKLGLPANFSKWPRTVHARLVDLLKEKGAAVIAFDVHFVEARDRQEDRDFARSIRQAGNVVLFEKIKRESTPFPGENGPAGTLEMERLIPPLPMFAESARALAPFPLPKLPVRVNQVWLFKTSAGERPTLPAAALQVLGLRYSVKLKAMVDQVVQSSPGPLPLPGEIPSMGDVRQFGQSMRAVLLQRPEIAGRLLSGIATDSSLNSVPEERRILQAVVRMSAGPDSLYLNYYGPPATLPTYSYSDLLLNAASSVLNPTAPVFKDKVVFVGASRKTWAGQVDGFYTVFSQPDGLDLSGVELAATAFANLYENKPVRPLSSAAGFVLIVLTGFLLALLFWMASPLVAVLLSAAFSLCFLGVGSYLFSADGIWLPLVTPLVFQSFFALLASLYWKIFKVGRERENIRKALRFYLPEKAVTALVQDLSFIRTGDQMVYSVCLMTDARNYTTLSEKMHPRVLSLFMKEYYSHLFEPVNTMGGVVSDVVGDSMLALWPSTKPGEILRKNACRAAVRIVQEVERFNRHHQGCMLHTRIGLHFGYMLMGNIGAGSHFEYAPIGDVVNTASRIEGLNKHLGTTVLATEEVVAGLPDIATRNVGIFLLPGKSKPVTVYELFVLEDGISAQKMGLVYDLFSRGLSCFTEKRWRDAEAFFQECTSVQANDGPSLFYLNLCRKYRQNPPGLEWQPIVHIDKK